MTDEAEFSFSRAGRDANVRLYRFSSLMENKYSIHVVAFASEKLPCAKEKKKKKK